MWDRPSRVVGATSHGLRFVGLDLMPFIAAMPVSRCLLILRRCGPETRSIRRPGAASERWTEPPRRVPNEVEAIVPR